MRWSLPLILLALALGCVPVHRSSGHPLAPPVDTAGGHAGIPGAERYFTATAKGDVARVANITYFDLASCFPPPPAVTDLFGDEQLLGALAMARPAVLECLVDPAHRGPRKETHATVSAVARPGAGVEETVGGENLTPAGELCVLEAARGVLAALPPLPEGWPPVAAQVDFVHNVDTLPAVTPRLNELSDAAGKIRLAMPTLCPCFEPWREAPPREIEVMLTLRRPPGWAEASRTQEMVQFATPSKVQVASQLSPADAPVGACLQEKLGAMEYRSPKKLEYADVPFYFQFIDSRRDAALPGLAPWLQHKQLEAVRNRRFAEMAIALGARSSAARNYDALVKRYQGDRSVKVRALAQACTGLLEADDAWETAVQRKLQTERLALETARAIWQGPLGAFSSERKVVAERLAETERSLATATQVRQVDERACPRTVRGPASRKRRDAPLLQVTPFSP